MVCQPFGEVFLKLFFELLVSLDLGEVDILLLAVYTERVSASHSIESSEERIG